MTDPELIARVLFQEDQAAFGELVRRHQSAVRHFLRHLTKGDAALADDLAQETFVQAYRNLSRFENRATFATWLLGIAHNHWRNARRRARTVPLDAEHLAALEPVPSIAALSDLQQDLAQALGALDADEQT
ncbi:MAG TPA: RNA polymerase sigma factor, partial [Candidatus Didemnitutus sp.]|nr:RNA polymerase sigma factor [Candidatus Didemnitutus sp.]